MRLSNWGPYIDTSRVAFQDSGFFFPKYQQGQLPRLIYEVHNEDNQIKNDEYLHPGRGALPYVGGTGMCRPSGYTFCPIFLVCVLPGMLFNQLCVCSGYTISGSGSGSQGGTPHPPPPRPPPPPPVNVGTYPPTHPGSSPP